MNRREFSRAAAQAVAAAVVLPAASRVESAASGPESREDAAVPRLSVMLWTVFRGLPFEQRLEKVAEAGYRAVELVEELQADRVQAPEAEIQTLVETSLETYHKSLAR